MLSRKAPCAAPLASLALIFATSLGGRAQAAGDCMEAISEASSRALFDALATARPSDGCTLENVVTDRSQMKIEWTKGGHRQEAILIVPTSCVPVPTSPGKLSTIVPPAVDAACPAAVAATRKLAEGTLLGELVPLVAATPLPAPQAPPPPRWRQLIAPVAGGLGAAAAIAGGLVALRWRKRKAPTPAAPPPGAPTDAG